MGDEHHSRTPDYRSARIGAGLALVGVIVVILLVDALSADYEASPVVLTVLLGTITALMGVQLVKP